jgi:hypothetical protein
MAQGTGSRQPGARRDERRGWAVPCLFGVFLLLIGAAWVVTNPPGAGPDERAHFIKAVGAGGGELRGHAPTVGARERRLFEKLGRTAEGRARLKAFVEGAQADTPKARWYRRTSREFTIPAGLNFSAFGCGRLGTAGWGTCLERGRSARGEERVRSYVGTYQPYVYVAPGLAARLTSDPLRAMRLARAVNALLCLGLLLVACVVLWDGGRGGLSLAGLAVAATPAVVFFATVVNPSGPELAAGVCFAASLLRLTRPARGTPTAWVAAAASGAVLAMSRSLGPLFVVLIGAAVALLAGGPRVAAVLRATPVRARAAAAVVAAALLAGLLWELEFQPHVSSSPAAIADNLDGALDTLPRLPREAAGAFGALDTFMPLSAYVAWGLMLLALVASALAVGSRRERVVLAGLLVAIPVFTLAAAAVYRQTGFELQARYALPFATLLPLASGEVLLRHGRRLGGRGPLLAAGLVCCAAFVQALAWYSNGRQMAGGDSGGAGFLSGADWEPPLGWPLWLAAVVLAALAYAAAGVWAAREPRLLPVVGYR